MAETTLYRLCWESVSAMEYPQFYDWSTERAKPIDPTTIPDDFWHETCNESTEPWHQRNGLLQLIREGELIRNVRLFKAAVAQPEWEAVDG